MPVELILDAETFVGLGAVTEGAQSALSPWNGVDAAITETRRAQLAAAGAIDARGAKPELRPALAAMSAATATTTLLFTSSELQLEYLTWVSGDRGPVGLSATSAGTYRLQDPPPIEPMMSALADLIGRSGLRGLDLTLELSIDDGFVFAAIVDSLRRRLLSSLATGDEVADMHVDLAQLLASLTEPPTGISFFGAIARLCGNDAVPEANRLTDSLTRLADQGLVEVGPTTVGLIGACPGLPLHFLVISSVIELANACGSTEAHIRRLGFTCLQAGVNDLLTVERVDDRIHMETLSADTLVRYIDCLVRTPDAEGSTAAPQPQGAGATEIMAIHSVQLPSVAPSRAGNAPPWQPTPPVPAAGLPAWSGPTYPPGPDVSTAEPVAPEPPGRSWRPTHLAPAGGMPAWSTPVGAGVPTARIDAGVELQVLTRAGQWAHIVCSNGWSAWVDGAAMAELRSR